MKLFKPKELGILWPFYLASLILSMTIFFGPFWIIYMQGIGLSFKQISILVAIYSIAPILFEIPTGAIADIYGRKISVLIGYICMGITIMVIPFTEDYYFLILLFFLWAIFSTLCSGADDAWIVDLLKHKKKEKLLHGYFVKGQSIATFGVIFLGILSSLSVKYFGIKSIWIVTGIGIIISAIILSFGKEHFVKQKTTIRKSINKTLDNSKKAYNYSRKDSVILFLLLAGFFVVISASFGSIAWQPFLINIGLEVHNLGYIYSLIAVVLIGIPFLSNPLLKKIGKEKYFFALLTLINIIVLLILYFTDLLLIGILVMIAINILAALDQPVNATYFQRFVPTKIRATMGSLRSMFIASGAFIGIIAAGFIADAVGPKMTIVYSAFFMIPAIYFYLKIKDN